MNNVIIDGRVGLVPGCELETCFYCPYARLNSNDLYENDRKEVVDVN